MSKEIRVKYSGSLSYRETLDTVFKQEWRDICEHGDYMGKKERK